MRWRKALDKFSSRAASYAQSGVAPSWPLAHFETHILPTLSYVAQMVAADGSVHHAFVVAIDRLLHVPHRAVPTPVLQQLRALGLPDSTYPMLYTAAALGRTALVMADVVRDEAERLAEARWGHASLASLAAGAPQHDAVGWADAARGDMMGDACRRCADELASSNKLQALILRELVARCDPLNTQ